MNTDKLRKALFNATGYHHYTMHVSSRGVEFNAANTTVHYDSFDELELDAQNGLAKFKALRTRAQREQQVCEINDMLQKIAASLREMSGDGERVILTIDTDNDARLGGPWEEDRHLTLPKLAAEIYEALTHEQRRRPGHSQ